MLTAWFTATRCRVVLTNFPDSLSSAYLYPRTEPLTLRVLRPFRIVGFQTTVLIAPEAIRLLSDLHVLTHATTE
jgi:hypothetical protein